MHYPTAGMSTASSTDDRLTELAQLMYDLTLKYEFTEEDQDSIYFTLQALIDELDYIMDEFVF